MDSSGTDRQVTGRFYTVVAALVFSFVCGAVFDNDAALTLACFLVVFLGWCYILARRNGQQSLSVARQVPSRAFAREPFAVQAALMQSQAHSPVMCVDYSDQLFGNGHYFSGPEAHAAVQATVPEPLQLPYLNASGQAVGQICTVRKRGVYSSFDCRATSLFPFGLFEYSVQATVSQRELVVYPFPEQPPALEHLLPVGIGIGNDNRHARRDTTGEFKGLRGYASGDPVKLIHWPLSARYQNLVVKDFEPVAPEEVIILFHSFWPVSGRRMPSPEYALQILAGMVILLHNSGTEFSFYPSYAGYDEIRVTDDPETLEEVLESLARADVQPLTNLAPLTEVLETLPEDDRRVIVFSNIPRRHWQDQLGSDNSLICLDCRMELDLEHLSASSRRRRLEGVPS